jgi:hypothetical protein
MSRWAAAAAAIRRGVVALRARAGLAGRTFSSAGPIDALIYGIWGRDFSDIAVTRESALSIGAVERGRDEICSVGTLALVNFRGYDVVANAFLEQPDPDIPRVVMLAQTLEDLLCDGISWWLKTSLDYRGFPLTARRVVNVSLTPPPGQPVRTPAPLPSGQDPRGASVWVDGVEVPAVMMIRFDSPGRPLLTAGARTIRRALLIDRLAEMYADNPRPLEVFTDTDDQTVAPYQDPEVEAFLATYKRQRKLGGPAWIPKQAQRVDINAPSPAELQLVELQRQVALELALHMGLDPEDVGVNTTSRTYFNATDRRTDKINRTLSGYMSAVTDRLSMGDITPRGQLVRWDTSEWLRPDAAAVLPLWQAGLISDREARAAAGFIGPAPAPGQPVAVPSTIGQNMRVLPAQLGPALTAQRMAALPAGATFAAEPGTMLRFSGRDFAAAVKPATADLEKRTITGLAVPYNEVARKYGVGFRFRPGSLEYDAANLNRLRAMDGHLEYVGVHQNVTDGKDGPTVTLKILDGPDGSPTKMRRDQLLMDAAGGLQDGLSIGVDFSLDPAEGDVVWSEAEQVFDVVRATWNETSVTPDPAFTGARVTKVSASRYGGIMSCQHCGLAHPPGMACAIAAQLYPPNQQPASGQQYVMVQGPPPANGGQYYSAAGVNAIPAPWPSNQPPPPPQNAPAGQPYAPLPPGQFAAQLPTGPVSAEELTRALTGVVNNMVASGQVAAAPPADAAAGQFAQPVNPGAMPIPGAAGQPAPGATFGTFKVTEPDPYRLTFDKHGLGIMGRGTHDLSGDYHAWFTDGDKAAHDRALAFIQRKMAAVFNVATTDVDETNPTRQRPEMWVDQREYRYPIWSAVNKGSLTDITPFAFPKFNTSSGLVGAHTQGTEPTTGSYTTTGQTVTPTAYSGKARINREVWDQGGNPQTSTLIWNQMVRGVNEALEAAIVTELNAGTFTALNTFTAGAVDRAAAGKTLGSEMEHAIALLQFARGGYAFTDGFLAADPYVTLTDAADTGGEKLYPMLGPTNRNGTAESVFSSINVGGQRFQPAWALPAAGQTAAAKLGYLVDRTSVWGWASPPQRLTLDGVAVAYVDLGVWGYQATAVSDTAGVRTITWDPVA